MKKYIALLFGLGLLNGGTAAEVAGRPNLFWTHYVPWHTPGNSSIAVSGYYNYPKFEVSGDSQTDYRSEIRQAMAMGLDGFSVDVVCNPAGGPPAFGEMIQALLQAAEGTGFQIAICLDVKTSVPQQIADLKKLLDACAGHPNYPHHQGKPLIFTYTFGEWTPEELTAIRQGLADAGQEIVLVANMSAGYQPRTAEWLESYQDTYEYLYSFAENGIDQVPPSHTVALFRDIAARGEKSYIETLWPGYYGAWVNGRNDFYQPHFGFDQLHDNFTLIPAATRNWLHVTTWNDHDETSILPMIFTSANPRIIRAYADSVKGIAPTATTPQLQFAYHREELLGTLIRLEAMSLPTACDGEATIAGRVLDVNGEPIGELASRTLSLTEYDRCEWLLPSEDFAPSPVIYFELTVSDGENTRTALLPPQFLVHGWLQNAVTVKVPHDEMVSFPQQFELSFPTPDTVAATIQFDAPAPIRSAVLWRNDRPLARFDQEADPTVLLHLFCSAGGDFELELSDGDIRNAVRKFAGRDDPDFLRGDRRLTARANLPWTPVALELAVRPETLLTFSVAGQEPVTLSATELNGRGVLDIGALHIEATPFDATVQNNPPLSKSNGSLSLTSFTREAHDNDAYFVRYELTDGRTALTPVRFPALGRRRFPVNVVSTATTLETPSGASGEPGRREFFDSAAATRPNGLRTVEIDAVALRAGRWNFNGHGRDFLGDLPFAIDARFQTPERNALLFSGNGALAMRLRSWPQGNATIDFKVNPASGFPVRQCLIGRDGWSDAINLFLLPDGRLEVVRDGNAQVPVERLISTEALPFDRWSQVRVTCDSERIALYRDGQPIGEMPIRIARSYGNCAGKIGGGFGDAADFHGQIDDLTILSAAFPPGDPQEPAWVATPEWPPLRSKFDFTVPPGQTPTALEWQAVAPTRNAPDAAPDATWSDAALTTALLHPGPDGAVVLQAGPGTEDAARNARLELTGELRDHEMIAIPLLSFTRREPVRNWAALLISVSNANGQKYNFNIGEAEQLMISVNDPEWRILTAHFPYKLPVELRVARYRGQVLLSIGDRRVYAFADDPEQPFSHLEVSMTLPDAADGLRAGFGAPLRYRIE